MGLQTIPEKQKEQCRILGIKSAKKVLQYDLQGNFIKEWQGTREVERQTKICQANVSSCCIGKRKTAGGYIWRYAV